MHLLEDFDIVPNIKFYVMFSKIFKLVNKFVDMRTTVWKSNNK